MNLTTGELFRHMLDTMSKHGWRITEQRKQLAAFFTEAEGYVTAKDVYDHLRVHHPGVSFDTVYRNLRLLTDMGVLEQFSLQDGVKFRARCHGHHHHHFICNACEKTYTFEFCPMQYVSNIPADFEITSHRFEIFGFCTECQTKSKPIR